MQVDRIKRACLIGLVAALSTIAAPKARAETITLSCFSGASTFVIDLSAKTGKLNATGQAMSNLTVSENSISFVLDIPRVERTSWQIDRVTGQADIRNYYYPGSPIQSQTPFNSTRCEKIPNRAF
jgi:hypothetical protein